MGQAYTYVEPEGIDSFHREPFIAQFKAKAGSFDFILITVHTDPDEATEEIHSLAEVLVQAKAHYQGEGDFIILGDFNADCDYYDESQSNPVPDTEWLITNSADTTVRTTVCTYDRIIVTEQVKEDYTGTAQVFKFDKKLNLTYNQAVKISDHYPVYAEFYVEKDRD